MAERWMTVRPDGYLPTACNSNLECGTHLPGRPYCDYNTRTCKDASGNDGWLSEQHPPDAKDEDSDGAFTTYEETKDATQKGCTCDSDCTKRYTRCHIKSGQTTGECVRGFPEYRFYDAKEPPLKHLQPNAMKSLRAASSMRREDIPWWLLALLSALLLICVFVWTRSS